jgi:hypothetical protein
VLYDYEAKGDTELSLVAAQVIELLKRPEKEEWWEGRAPDGRTGYFPKNYVKLLPPAMVKIKRSNSSKIILLQSDCGFVPSAKTAEELVAGLPRPAPPPQLAAGAGGALPKTKQEGRRNSLLLKHGVLPTAKPETSPEDEDAEERNYQDIRKQEQRRKLKESMQRRATKPRDLNAAAATAVAPAPAPSSQPEQADG